MRKLIALILVLLTTFCLFACNQTSTSKANTTPTEPSSTNKLKNNTNILFIGTKNGQLTKENVFLMLLSIDTTAKDSTIFYIPFFIQADVDLYSSNGEFYKTEKLYIYDAYSQGKDEPSKCNNTVKSVSRLFNDAPISSYITLDISNVAYLNDMLGGVTVTLTDDYFYDTNNKNYKSGQSIKLYGENVVDYIYYVDPNADYIERLNSYINAFFIQLAKIQNSDCSILPAIYDMITKQENTNLTESDFISVFSLITEGEVMIPEVIEYPK